MRICLYGASSNQIDEKYIGQTEAFGRILARRGHSLVYGGGAQGLMGAAARGVHEKGGRIYNMLGYYDTMRSMMEEAIEKHFMKLTCRELYAFLDNAEAVLDYLESYKASKVEAKYFKNI